MTQRDGMGREEGGGFRTHSMNPPHVLISRGAPPSGGHISTY